MEPELTPELEFFGVEKSECNFTPTPELEGSHRPSPEWSRSRVGVGVKLQPKVKNSANLRIWKVYEQ